MAKILHLTASPRAARSNSRRISTELVEAFLAKHPGDSVTLRDVGHEPPPHVTETWVVGAFAPPEHQTTESKAAMAISEVLINELMSHDVIVIGTPMYNFGIPSTLKAYIDQIVRVGRTFGFDASKLPNGNPYVPLVHGKRLFIVTSYGGAGYAAGQPLAMVNYTDTYLKAIFGFLGVADVTTIDIPNASGGDEALAQSLAAARRQVAAAVNG